MLTTAAAARAAARRAYRREHPADSWEDRGLNDRCMFTTGLPMVPSAYNNNVHLFQTPDHVVLLHEMIHEVRVIPLDGRAHLPPGVRQWLGDARGHWEGATLVVDTRNFDPKQLYRGWSQGNVRLTERFTRVGADMLHYAVTFEDAAQWVTPWTADLTLRRTEGPLFEYACHEGNVGMANTLEMMRGEDGERP